MAINKKTIGVSVLFVALLGVLVLGVRWFFMLNQSPLQDGTLRQTSAQSLAQQQAVVQSSTPYNANLLCDAAHKENCLKMAYEYYALDPEGVGSKQKVVELYDKACAFGLAEGCYKLANIHVFDRKNKEKGAYFFEKACGLGLVDGCVQIAGAYEHGEGVIVDKVKAVHLYDKACAMKNAAACFAAAKIYDEGGEGAIQDAAQALTLYTQACDLDNADGCYNLAVMYEEHNDTEQSTRFLKKACALGDAESCTEMKKIP